MPALARVEPASEEDDPRRRGQPAAAAGVRRHGMRLGAARFVAGETLDDAVVVLRRLNDNGLKANTTLLGEGVNDEAETRVVVEAYKEILDRIAAERLRVNVALKLTHLGLTLRRGARAREHRRARRARRRASATSSGSTWRSRRSSTRRCACSGRSARRATRTSAPSSSRTSTAPRPTSRSCSRSSRTSASSRAPTSSREAVAYPEKSDVDAAYARLIERSLTAGGFTAIATHDEALIDHAKSFAEDNDIPRTRFQFQMLYGVRSKLQLDLVAGGLRRPRRDPVRARLVPLPDAPPRRAAGERALHRAQPRPSLTPRERLTR